MASQEKEVSRPFLDDDHESRDGSLDLELPELTRHDENSRSSSDGIEMVNEKTPSAKRSATYAIVFMLGAQVFSASMNVSIRLLENASTHLHPLQVSRPS